MSTSGLTKKAITDNNTNAEGYIKDPAGIWPSKNQNIEVGHVIIRNIGSTQNFHSCGHDFKL